MEVRMYHEHGSAGALPAINVKQYGRFGDGLTPELLNCSAAVFNRAMEWAWEAAVARFWESAGEMATHYFGPGVCVNSAGRSGGWLIVSGLPEPAEWDTLTREAWDAFEAAALEEMRYLSAAEHVKTEIIENRWNEEGAEEYNFIDTAAGESRCMVDVKRERAAAPELHKALEMAEIALTEFYGASDRDNPLMTIIRAALALAAPKGGRG